MLKSKNLRVSIPLLNVHEEQWCAWCVHSVSCIPTELGWESYPQGVLANESLHEREIKTRVVKGFFLAFNKRTN